jgi:Protein involved in catabolism of external DNA
MLLRPQDELRAFELHPTEQKILRATLAASRRATAIDGDGFEGLRSQLPPPTRRGAVLVDPSYEGNADYGKVVATLRDAVARFADGVYVVWYPQVSKVEAAELPRRLAALAPKGWLHARLSVQDRTRAASASRAAACSCSTRRTRCTRRWRRSCRIWSRFWASTRVPTS